MAPLRARVLAWLAANGQGSVEQIARGVNARTADVRDELRKLASEELATAASEGSTPQTQRTLYLRAAEGGDGPGRADSHLSGALAALSGRPQPTQGDQILALLADGTVWSSHDLHRQVFCVLHSRIAELRRRLHPLGFDIEHSGGGSGTDCHFYRLALLREPSVPEPAADGSLSGAVDPPHATPPGLGDTANDAAQLTLLGAAA